MSTVTSKNFTTNSHHTNRVATRLDWLGRKLTFPVSYVFLEQLGKTFRSMNPGHWDQASTKKGEIACRVARTALWITSLPVAVAGGVVGGALRMFASCSRADFVFIRPEKDVAPKQLEKLTLCTFNVSMMPGFINILGRDFSPPLERVEAMAQALIDCGADVLCLQEAFNTDAQDKLVELIKKEYPYIIFNAGFSSYRLSSGLMIASKFPITNPQFWEHTHKIGTEYLAAKGTLAVTIQPSPDQKIPVFNTHLEAGMDTNDVQKIVAYRTAQLAAIQIHAKEYRKGLPTAFLCGDTNIRSGIDKEQNDHKELSKLILDDPNPLRQAGSFYSKLPKIHAKLASPCGCFSSVKSYVGNVDYIGALRPTNISEIPTESRQECMGGTSDHDAWIATFDLNPINE